MKVLWSARGIVVTLASVAALVGCGDKFNGTNAVAPVPVPEAEWTVAVFMAADNNLADAGIDDIDKMEAAGVDPRVRVVVQAEFSPKFLAAVGCDSRCFNRPNFNTFRYVITGEGNSVRGPNGPTIDIGQRNMVDPAELRDFIEWVKQNHPAKRLLVVLWDHGGGWHGLLEDDTQAPGKLMSISELQTALANESVNVLDFDMCNMAGYEVLSKIDHATSFAVVSEETVPGSGLPYTEIIRALNANPTADGATVAELIADEYHAHYAGGPSSTTISAFDMNGFDALEAALDQLATSFRTNLETLFPPISEAGVGAQRFHFQEMMDIVSFLDSLEVRVQDSTLRSEIDALRAQSLSPDFRLRNFFNTGTGPRANDVSRANGLHVVLPPVGGDAIDFATYRALLPDKPWTAFLGDYIARLPEASVASAPSDSTTRCASN